MRERFEVSLNRVEDLTSTYSQMSLTILDRKQGREYHAESDSKEEMDALRIVVHKLNREVNGEPSAPHELDIAISRYLEEVFHENDAGYVMRMIAGVRSFLHVNYDGQPYEPVFMFPTEEQPKKWYQFWRKE